MKKQEHILVSGCAGFIGSHLCERLLALGYEITGIDNFDPFYSRSIKENNLRSMIANPAFHFYETDLRSPTFYTAFASSRIDGVIHLAAKAGVRPSIADPDGYLTNNINGSQHLLSFMLGKGIKKLIFGSSSSVYGNANEAPFQEEGEADEPISPYAFSKRAGELLNRTYHHLYGLNVINLRFFTVYGPRQRPDLAIHKFMRLMLEKQPISMYGDGNSKRDYTYVDDIVEGIISAYRYLDSKKTVYETINLGNNRPVSLTELIQLIGKVCGTSPDILLLPQQPGDVELTCASTQKAASLLAYAPKVNLEEGLKRFLNWLQVSEKAADRPAVSRAANKAGQRVLRLRRSVKE